MACHNLSNRFFSFLEVNKGAVFSHWHLKFTKYSNLSLIIPSHKYKWEFISDLDSLPTCK